MPILRLIGDDWTKESKVNFSFDPNKAVKDYRTNIMKLLSLRNIREYTFWHVAEDGESPDMTRDPLNLDWKWSDYGFQPNMFVYLRKSQPGDRKCDPNAKPSPPPPPAAPKPVEASTPPPAPSSTADASGTTSSTVIHLIGDRWIKEQRKVLALKPSDVIEKYLPTIGKKLEIELTAEGMLGGAGGGDDTVGQWFIWPVAANGMKPDLEQPPMDPRSTWESCGVKHKGTVYLRVRKEGDKGLAVPPAAAVEAAPAPAAMPEVVAPLPAAPLAVPLAVAEPIPASEVSAPAAVAPPTAAETAPLATAPVPPPPAATAEEKVPTAAASPPPPAAEVPPPSPPPQQQPTSSLPPAVAVADTAHTTAMPMVGMPQHPIPSSLHAHYNQLAMTEAMQQQQMASAVEQQALKARIRALEAQIVTMQAKERVREEDEALRMAAMGYPPLSTSAAFAAASSPSYPYASSASPPRQLAAAGTVGDDAHAQSPRQLDHHRSDGYSHGGYPSSSSSSPLHYPHPHPHRHHHYAPPHYGHHGHGDVAALQSAAHHQLAEMEGSMQRRRGHASAAVALYEMAHYRQVTRQLAGDPIATNTTAAARMSPPNAAAPQYGGYYDPHAPPPPPPPPLAGGGYYGVGGYY